MIYFHSEVQELFTSRYTIELRMNDFTRLDVNDPVCKSTRHRPRVRRGVMGSFFLRQDSKKSSHNRVISFDIELRDHTTHRQPTVIEMRCSNQHKLDLEPNGAGEAGPVTNAVRQARTQLCHGNAID